MKFLDKINIIKEIILFLVTLWERIKSSETSEGEKKDETSETQPPIQPENF